jgi:hypothetical protein
MIVLDDGNISVPFSRTNGMYTFTDALVIAPNAYDALTPDEITAMQDARFADWVAQVEQASNAPAEELPIEVPNGE